MWLYIYIQVISTWFTGTAPQVTNYNLTTCSAVLRAAMWDYHRVRVRRTKETISPTSSIGWPKQEELVPSNHLYTDICQWLRPSMETQCLMPTSHHIDWDGHPLAQGHVNRGQFLLILTMLVACGKRMCSTCESLEPRNPAILEMKLVQLLYCFSNPWSWRFIIDPEIFKRSCGQRTYKSKANKMPDSFSKLPNVGLHLQSFMPKLGLSGIETRVYINHVDT
jgi:hypothetical protein